jgi:hypothetical protein
MLEEILAHINNYFVIDVYEGGYEISNGTISLPFLSNNQYFKISGSIFNDGVYKYPETNLIDESFTGYILALAIPKDLIALEAKINTFCINNPASAFTSESFGGYSYSKATNSNSGSAADWTNVFRSELNRWRKI